MNHQIDQEEIAEIVALEVRLDSVLRLHPRSSHYRGKPHKPIDGNLKLPNRFRRLAHRGQPAEIHRYEYQLRLGMFVVDIVNHRLRFGLRLAHQDNGGCIAACQGLGGCC